MLICQASTGSLQIYSGPGGPRTHDRGNMRWLEHVRAGSQSVAACSIIAAPGFAILLLLEHCETERDALGHICWVDCWVELLLSKHVSVRNFLSPLVQIAETIELSLSAWCAHRSTPPTSVGEHGLSQFRPSEMVLNETGYISGEYCDCAVRLFHITTVC